MANRSGLHKVVKTVRGKKGAVRRSYWVKSEGAPGAAPKHGMAHRLLKVAAGAALLGYAAHKAGGYLAAHGGGEHDRRGALGAIAHGVGSDILHAHSEMQKAAERRKVFNTDFKPAGAPNRAPRSENALSGIGHAIHHAASNHLRSVQDAAAAHLERRHAEHRAAAAKRDRAHGLSTLLSHEHHNTMHTAQDKRHEASTHRASAEAFLLHHGG